jgi:hypothetical protein
MILPKKAPEWKVVTMFDWRLARAEPAAVLSPKARWNDGSAKVPPMKPES